MKRTQLLFASYKGKKIALSNLLDAYIIIANEYINNIHHILYKIPTYDTMHTVTFKELLKINNILLSITNGVEKPKQFDFITIQNSSKVNTIKSILIGHLGYLKMLYNYQYELKRYGSEDDNIPIIKDNNNTVYTKDNELYNKKHDNIDMVLRLFDIIRILGIKYTSLYFCFIDSLDGSTKPSELYMV